MVKIRQLSPEKDQVHLTDVIRLWREHSKTLGFFATGAFEEYAAKGQILIALNHADQCIGYLLYRISREVAIIVHLCVSSKSQKQSVARLLVDQLKTTTRELRGIRLSCRRDFYASRIWPKYGFIALSDRPGRSLDGKPLTSWWFDHGHPNLFTQIDVTLPEKICVVIDANVFFDFNANNDPDSEESKALTADWIQANIELCVTPELLNEINRQPDSLVREKERIRFHTFRMIQRARDNYEKLEREVEKLFQLEDMTPQDESDVRQVADAISGDAQFFVTRDSVLLNHADSIYEKFGLTIIRPADLIVHLDNLESESDYLTVRLAGTGCTHRLVKAGELDSLLSNFQQSSIGESVADFRRKLTALLSDPRQHSCYIILDSNADKLALYATCKKTDSVIDISIFRVKNFSLGKTLARYLATSLHLKSSLSGPMITTITEKYLQPFIKTALIESGYVPKENYWQKIGLPVVGGSEKIIEMLNSFVRKLGSNENILDDITKKLKTSVLTQDHIAGADIERALWPAKITDLPIFNYIVPIQPAWAKDLFDERLAYQDLFGAKLDVALQQEGVYYRKNYFGTPCAPGRILWYVSFRKGFLGSGNIRACSRLDEVIIDKPKELFRKFRRLGIYDWKNVYQTAGKNINSDIMVLRFSHTEQFNTPISLNDLQKILRPQGIKTNMRSPVSIDAETFAEIYKKGKT